MGERVARLIGVRAQTFVLAATTNYLLRAGYKLGDLKLRACNSFHIP